MTTEFSEVQRFTQWWLWVIILLSTAVMLVVFGFGLIEQLVYGRPWGDRPVSDAALIVISGLVILFVGVMIYIFYTLRLITRVDDAGVFVRFYPFPGKVIPFSEIQSCEARTYRPLYEYGGWGIKYGRGGKAYNISGDKGAQLVLKTGKRVLIGSQMAEELASVINRQLLRGS